MTATPTGDGDVLTADRSLGAGPSGEARLQARNVTLAYDARVIVEDLSVDIPNGKFTVVVGANACGKSTLLRGLARLLALRGGVVLLDGEPIHRSPTREVATKLGILPQQPTAPDGLCVGDLVARGRHPHLRWYRRWSVHDDEIVSWALEVTGMSDLAGRVVDELSGGQRQRAWIAMALAQDTPTMLLDEPTTFLDLAHQCEVMDLLERLNKDDGRTVVAVLHDLNQAARYADHMIAMKAGRIVAAGPPAEVVTPEQVEHVFGLAVHVQEDPLTGTPMVIPIPQRRRC
jgi:iron complex transport system ATP-binding protein